MNQKRKESNPDNSKIIITLFIVFIIMIVLCPGLVLIMFIIFIPTLAATLLDRTRNHALSFCVGICNLAAAIPCLFNLLETQFSMMSVYAAIHDPLNLLMILSGAGFGWVIYIGVPTITTNYYRSYDKSYLQKLLKRYKTIQEHWGEDIPESETITQLLKDSQD